MERLVYILFDFGYALIFGILGLVTLLLQTSHESGMESYRRARKTLGIGLLIISGYCVARLIDPQHHIEYRDFWILVTINLVFSWLTYLTLLFLMESPRYLTKSFYIDGVIPTAMIILTGTAGMFFPAAQNAIRLALGGIFCVKCSWMFYICMKEYKKCLTELSNYYGNNGPDINWIRNLMWLCLYLSVSTIISFYYTEIHLVYYLTIPIIYAYMVFKIVNFAPKKIDNIRKKNEQMIEKPQEQPGVKTKYKEIPEKVAPLVYKWVENKGYCKSDITIKDVAAEMGTNHNYLSQYINNALGMTFQQWLNTLRIEESKKILLSDRNLSIEEVGASVGIPQSYNYSKWFKAVTDMTPFRYRKEYSK